MVTDGAIIVSAEAKVYFTTLQRDYKKKFRKHLSFAQIVDQLISLDEDTDETKKLDEFETFVEERLKNKKD